MKTGFRFVPTVVTILALILASATSCFLIDEPKDYTFFISVEPPDVGNTVNTYDKVYVNEEGELVTAKGDEPARFTGLTHTFSYEIPPYVKEITAEAIPGPGYKFDHWEGVFLAVNEDYNNTEEFIDIMVEPGHTGSITAHFVRINPEPGGPGDWETPEDPGPNPEDIPHNNISADIASRVEIIESPEGCINSILYIDYEARAYRGHYVNFLQLKKDGKSLDIWQGKPTVHYEDNTLMEVPCIGSSMLQLYSTNTNGDEVKVVEEVFHPDVVASLTWDVEPVPGEECRMTLQLDFWGSDNHGDSKQLTSLILTANGEPWYENDSLTENFHENSVTKTVTCGQIYAIDVTATDVDGNKYTWRETINIPEPEPEDEPPPQEPPQDAPPAFETLYVAFALTGQCMASEHECTCTVSYSVDGEDRSTGDVYPITNVLFEVNDGTGWQVWHDSGAISTPAYHHAGQKTGVDCDKAFNVRVTATNSIGQTLTDTATFTTAHP